MDFSLGLDPFASVRPYTHPSASTCTSTTDGPEIDIRARRSCRTKSGSPYTTQVFFFFVLVINVGLLVFVPSTVDKYIYIYAFTDDDDLFVLSARVCQYPSESECEAFVWSNHDFDFSVHTGTDTDTDFDTCADTDSDAPSAYTSDGNVCVDEVHVVGYPCVAYASY